MTTDVNVAFSALASSLTSSRTETSAAASHRSSLESCLTRNFDMKSFFMSGSFGNGTNVKGYSDVDRFAVIPTQKLKENSGNTLSAIAVALRETFPRTEVRVDAPGVRLPFGFEGNELTEVIPADEIGKTSLGYRMFEVPDGAGGWMKVAPETHNAYVTNIDKKLDNKLKPLIRLVKAWKFFSNLKISSFYLEMRVAEYASKEELIIYDIDVRNILAGMLVDNLADIEDPRGFAGILSPCKTAIQHTESLAAVGRGYRWADSALTNKKAGNSKTGFEDWDRVYNDRFPYYG